MTYPAVTLKSGKDRPVLQGHPWIFSGAIKDVAGGAHPGMFVSVRNNRGEGLGVGYYNPKSQISVRMLSRDVEAVIDAAFIAARVREARERRKPFLGDGTNAFRLIHSEADGLPGVIVDAYAGFLVLQSHTLGSETLRPFILEALETEIRPHGVYERSDLDVRHHEGLGKGVVGVIAGAEPEPLVEVKESGLNFAVDIVGGQKTGFFLDQRDNRRLVRQLSAGKKVLNLFSYSCATAIAALAGGAEQVVSVDSDRRALALAEEHLRRNGIDAGRHEMLAEEVREVQKRFLKEGRRFDLVILDPPAYVKHRGAMDNGLRGYRDGNARGLELLAPGGWLLTSSCSGLVDMDMFRASIAGAARDIRRTAIVQGEFFQPFDHPVMPAFPEGRYLKSLLVQVV